MHNLEHTIYEENTEPTLSHINVGTGAMTIKALAQTIKEVIGFHGTTFDKSKPDGTMEAMIAQRCLSSVYGAN